MATPTKLIAGLTALGAVGTAALIPAAAQAQTPDTGRSALSAPDSILAGATVVLRVDGMVCPFCAHGLETRLRKLAQVEEVAVRLNDGMVQIRERDGEQVTREVLEDAVRKAGFSLREVTRIRTS